jgi:hypothetical protein
MDNRTAIRHLWDTGDQPVLAKDPAKATTTGTGRMVGNGHNAHSPSAQSKPPMHFKDTVGWYGAD